MGNIGIARLIKQINRLMCRHGLQAVTEIIVFSIINDQTGAAIARDTASNLLNDQVSCRAIFCDGTVCHIGLIIADLPRGQFCLGECGPVNKAERAMRNRDKAMPPCRLPPYGLINW